MFDWFRKKKKAAKPAPPPERVKSTAERRPVQNYVYPPVANGIPRFPVAEILGEHEELIQRLRNLSEHKAVFDVRYRAVVERYANYIYLLPASEAHHHRGAGGLLRHGLEVAKYLLQQAYDRLHGKQMSPQKRKAARERWLFAGFAAGLCHDIGKAADMRVVSVAGKTWDPYSGPLAQWYQGLPPEDDRIYVSWRREGQDHRQMGLPLLGHILLPEDVGYLQEIEPMLMWINQAILGEKGLRNDITEMVYEGDKKSVSLDLAKSNVLADLGPQVGQPLARHYVLSMKRLVTAGMEGTEKRWRANQPGSVLWVIGKDRGVYLVFPEMTTDVTDLLHKDGTPGVPSNPEDFADILQEHGLLAMTSGGDRLWRLWPSVVDAGEEGLLALRLKEPGYIMDLVPPSVPGEVRGEGEEPKTTGKVIYLKSMSNNKQEETSDKSRPEPPVEQFQESETKETEKRKASQEPSPPSSGVSEEPGSLQGPRTLEELQEYFAGGGLGGRALLKFASEVAVYARRDGVDYITGPQLLLSWGERKFTEEGSLAEVIESLARAGWLVLNGSRRVHEEPGFGRCLKLRERETALFWRLVGVLVETKSPEPGLDAPFAGEALVAANEAQTLRETHPQETAATDPPGSPSTPAVEGEPKWVSEVAAMLEQHGQLDYPQVEELVKARTRRQRKIMELVNEYFLVNYKDGNLVVLRRQP